jgi:hypothetical protein
MTDARGGIPFIQIPIISPRFAVDCSLGVLNGCQATKELRIYIAYARYNRLYSGVIWAREGEKVKLSL